MPLQYRVSSSELRLQSQEFVARFPSNQARHRNLGTMLIPDFQGALALFKQSLILAADRCLDAEWFVHLSPLHGRLCTWFANKAKSRVLGSLRQKAAFWSVGSGTQKGMIPRSSIVIFTRTGH